MARLIALIGLAVSVPLVAQTHATSGIVTHAEYQQFLASHTLGKQPEESLLGRGEETSIARVWPMLFIEVDPTGESLSISIKKKEVDDERH